MITFVIAITNRLYVMRKIAILMIILYAVTSAAEITERIYLSGTDSENPKTWDFYCSDGMRSNVRSRIQVPSNWELQGFGNYTYGRFYKTKGARPSNESGKYTTTFKIPVSMQGKCFRLVFEGSMTDTQALIDGHPVGPVHQGGFTEFSYDITSLINPGKKQTLEVIVNKESANASVNSAERRADWWLFGGIYRPVYIEALPECHITGVSIDAHYDGHVMAKVRTKGANSATPIKMELSGYTPQYTNTEYSDSDGSYTIHAYYPGVSVWTPETPNLHTLTFTLGDKSCHCISEKTGFRTVEFRPKDGIYLNGKKLMVKGTNRHCFDPERGRAVSRSRSIEDAKLIKSLNMNAVRCHYPSDRFFLDACDSIGLLYLDEFPGWQTHYDDTTAMKLLPEFILRDVNRPSVFLWANGNEGGWNTCVDTLFAQYDLQQRKVIHPWSDFEGIDTHHYPAFQTGAYRLNKGRNVFMPTEFLHGQYDKGQGAGLEDFWDNWSRSHLFAGGFLWAFVDEAVRRTDIPAGKSKGLRFGDKGFDIADCVLDSDGPNGPDGCMDPYRQPEMSAYTIREVWSPIYIPTLHITTSFDGQIPVENRWIFTSLSDCSMRYKTYRCTPGQMTETGNGSINLPPVKPGERGYATFRLPENFFDNDILEISAYAPDGREVCTWRSFIRTPITETGSKEPGKVKVSFTPDGMIERINKGDRVIPLTGGPIPVGMKAGCYAHSHRIEPDGREVNVFSYRGGIDSIRWTLHSNGQLEMDAVILNSPNGHGFNGNFITEEGGWQIGLSFCYPESIVDSVRWIGNGPGRVWRNREKGMMPGLWSKAYNNTVTGQYGSAAPPVYPEFKGYHADVRYMRLFTHGDNGFSISSDNERLYVRLFTPEEPGHLNQDEITGPDHATKVQQSSDKKEKTMVEFPKGDISFLLSIPPIRSYKPLEQQGPQSQPDVIRIKPGDEGFKIHLIFDFN